jgi:hypothetical protein
MSSRPGFGADYHLVAQVARLGALQKANVGVSPRAVRDPTMPFKANADRRHRIPKLRQKITNWTEYDAGQLTRGSLTE